MGTMLPETCWAASMWLSNKCYNWLLHLVGCFIWIAVVNLCSMVISLYSLLCNIKLDMGIERVIFWLNFIYSYIILINFRLLNARNFLLMYFTLCCVYTSHSTQDLIQWICAGSKLFLSWFKSQGVTSQKIWLVTNTAVRTANLTVSSTHDLGLYVNLEMSNKLTSFLMFPGPCIFIYFSK
jgi:hypothetical protein